VPRRFAWIGRGEGRPAPHSAAVYEIIETKKKGELVTNILASLQIADPGL